MVAFAESRIFKLYKKNPAVVLILLSFFLYYIKYGVNVFLARHLGAAWFGDFSIAIRLLTIVSAVVLLGTHVSSKRFVPSYLSSDNTDLLKNFLAWNFSYIKRNVLICFMIALLSLIIMLVFHITSVKHIFSYHIAVYMFWIAPFSALALLLNSFLVSNRMPVVAVLTKNILKFLLIFLFSFFAIYLFQSKMTPFWLSIVLLLTFLTIILIEFILLFFHRRDFFKSVVSAALTHRSSADPLWIKVSLRLIFGNMLSILLGSLELIILEIFATHESIVGHFSAVLIICYIIWIINNNAYQDIKPDIAALAENKNSENLCKLQQKLNSVNLISLTTTFLIALFIFIYAKMFLLHFGPSYSNVVLPCRIIVVAFFFGTIGQPAVKLLSLSGGEKLLLYAVIFQLGLLILFGSIFTILYGVIGLSLTILFVNLISLIILLVLSQSFLSIKSLTIC